MKHCMLTPDPNTLRRTGCVKGIASIDALAELTLTAKTLSVYADWPMLATTEQTP